MRHAARDTPDFHAGVAYAAHCLRHAVMAAHGHSGYIPPEVEPNECCRSAILAFALGMVEGLEDRHGIAAGHEHSGGAA